MKTTQHTPGTWTAGQQRSIHNLDYTHCVWGPDGDSICNCNSVIGPNEANARLIAAAPELLEALKMALVQIVQDNDGRGVDHEHRLTEMQVRAAVAKAERGEQ